MIQLFVIRLSHNHHIYYQYNSIIIILLLILLDIIQQPVSSSSIHFTLPQDLFIQHGVSETGEPLYAKINRDLKTKRSRSICAANDNDLFLMTTGNHVTYNQNLYENHSEMKDPINNTLNNPNGSIAGSEKYGQTNQNQWI